MVLSGVWITPIIMEIEYITVRETSLSGGSAKVTIPIEMVKKWGKTKEKLSEGRPGVSLTSIEKFLICFIRSNGKLIMELPENVVASSEYPAEVMENVRKALIRYQAKTLVERYENLNRGLATGLISKQSFDTEVDKILVGLGKEIKTHAQSFSQRELHFMDIGKFDQLIASILIDEEQVREEDFLALIDDVKKFKDELDSIRGILKQLENGFADGRISAKQYEMLKERYTGKLTLAEERLNRLTKLVCGP